MHLDVCKEISRQSTHKYMQWIIRLNGTRESLILTTNIGIYMESVVKLSFQNDLEKNCHRQFFFPKTKNRFAIESVRAFFLDKNLCFFPVILILIGVIRKRVVISHIDKISLGRYHFIGRGDSVVWTKVAYYFVQEEEKKHNEFLNGGFGRIFVQEYQAYGVYIVDDAIIVVPFRV